MVRPWAGAAAGDGAWDWADGGRRGCWCAGGADTKSAASEELDGEEEDVIADLGKPKLGEITRCTITIRESKELKVRGRSLCSVEAKGSKGWVGTGRAWWTT